MTQEEVLSKIIEDNQFTLYGSRYHFNEIKSMQDYISSVPVSTYADYKKYIYDMIKGKKNSISVYPMACLLSTSGSSGIPKMIPLTREALVHYSDQIYENVMRYVPKGKQLHMSVFRTDLDREQEDNSLLSSVYYRYLVENGKLNVCQFVGGEKLLFSAETQDFMFLKVWSAFYEKDITAIHSIFLYDVLVFLRYIEEHGSEILTYMINKHIPDETMVSDGLKQFLIEQLMPAHDRIKEIREQLDCGIERIVERLWPKLYLISGIGGDFFQTREALLRKYTGNIKLHYFAFVSSECMYGKAVGLESTEYVMLQDNGFYEFESMDGQGTIHTCVDVEIGGIYELIVTNWSGLYRYRTEDVVQVTGFQQGMPVVQVKFRKNQAINIAGEKTSIEMMESAILKFTSENQLSLYDYSVWPDLNQIPARYLFLIEVEEHISKNQVKKLEASFDSILKNVNSDYMDLRNLDFICSPQIVVLKHGAHIRALCNSKRQLRQNKPMMTCRMEKVFDYEKERQVLE